MARYGFLDDAAAEDPPDLATEQWSPHELWFHRGSRAGHHDLPYGATGWAEGRFPPLPARRPPWPGAPVQLPVPEAGAPAMPLGAALRARRSLRTADERAPLTVAGLGEFLYLSAAADTGGPGGALRASPSGGGLHALELYPVVRTVDGLPGGMYHYDPYGHLLEPVPARPATVRRLLADATAATGGAAPQVLLVVSARFGRVMWKYRSMAYALVLKDLGALLQTMYLVATATGLAPCALGTGDADLFALATGLDPLAESSVGEFALSSRPDPG